MHFKKKCSGGVAIVCLICLKIYNATLFIVRAYAESESTLDPASDKIEKSVLESEPLSMPSSSPPSTSDAFELNPVPTVDVASKSAIDSTSQTKSNALSLVSYSSEDSDNSDSG